MQNIISRPEGGQVVADAPQHELRSLTARYALNPPELLASHGGLVRRVLTHEVTHEDGGAAHYIRTWLARNGLTVACEPWLGKTPRAWQKEALPIALDALAEDRRGIIRACTGAGKSILQAELIASAIDSLGERERIVVSAPTQKLVAQLGQTLAARCPGEVGLYYQYEKDLSRPIIVTCHASMWDSEVFCPECHNPEGMWIELEDKALERARLAFQDAAIGGDITRCQDAFGHTLAVARCHRLTEDMQQLELEVALWVADECHKTECDSVLGFAQWMAPARTIGFTATPWRADEHERLSLFDELLYDYGPSQAVQDGVVIRPTIVNYTGHASDQDEVCLEMIQAHLAAHPGPGVVSAYTIEDARACAAYLGEHGVRALEIHSELKGPEQVARIAALEAGEIDCLVHCSLLVEGVDFPWLQWLCMRRASASKIRFPQEVGRVLRVHPGKVHAWVLDPHDLFNTLSLDYEALLGGESSFEDEQAAVDQLAADVAALFAEERDASAVETGRAGRGLNAMEALRAWLRQTALAFRILGYEELRVSSTHWRTHEITESQIRMIEYTMRHKGLIGAAASMEEAQRVVLRKAIVAALNEDMTKGDASDLITILSVLRAQGTMPNVHEQHSPDAPSEMEVSR